MKTYLLHFKCITLLVLLTPASSYQVFGQTNPVPTVNQQEIRVLESEINVTTYKLEISLPMHYSENDTLRCREGDNMTSGMAAFEDSIKSRNYSGLDLTTHVFEDEGHMSRAIYVNSTGDD